MVKLETMSSTAHTKPAQTKPAQPKQAHPDQEGAGQDRASGQDKPAPERTGRLSADDWAQAALDLIAEQGVAAVAVEPLARRLGVTKGSFYWHFPSREALLVAALERWEKVEQEVFSSLEPIPDPRERLRALFRLVRTKPSRTSSIPSC